MRQSKATKRNIIRLWTLLLCLIVAFAMIQPLGGSYAYAAAAGIGSGSEASNNDGEAASGSAGGDERGSLRNSPAVWYDGTYEGTGNGYEGPVKLAVTIDGRKVDPPADYGTKVVPGVNEEGEYYVGGVVDELKAFTTETYQTIAEAMNDKYAEFPIDIALYGLEADALNKWEYTSTDADAEDSSGADAGNTPADSSQSQGSTGGTDLTGLVKLSAAKAQTSYKQPSVEIVPPEPEVLRDGTWYGRSEVTSEADPVDAAAGSQTGNGDAANNESGNAAAGASESGAPGAADSRVIVKITVKDGAIVGDPEVISGDAADTEAVEEAAAVARTKSVYGDATGYGQASADLFAGGKGTKEAPYLIENEKQLRAIAEAINEDESFRDVYFRQTADIDVSSEDWLPIGHGITAMIKAT